MTQLGDATSVPPAETVLQVPSNRPVAGLDPATRDFIELTTPTRAGLARLPGLDGLRGLAVIGVVAFHAGYSGMVGGYLGVSTFFTLSGFLIGSLLISESRAFGGVDVRRFWGRRFRRLMPAALLTLAGVMLLFGPFVATADQRQDLGGNVLASLFNVANWKLIVDGSSYSQLFVAPSPVLHFWSLAIEEQFYLIFPLLLVGLWRLARGRRGLLCGAVVALIVVFTVEPLVLSFSADRIYFGTDTRAPELLLGVLLAVVLSSASLRRRLALGLYWRTAAATFGVVALSIQLWWWWGLDQSTSWLYRGGFALYAVLTSLVIVAAALPSGPLRTALSVRPLRWVGARSYGIYLFHWPILLAIGQLAPGLSRSARTTLAVAATLALAEASYRWLERPVQRRRWPVAPRRSVVVACSAVAVVAALAFLPLPVDRTELSTDFEAASQRFSTLGQGEAPATTVVPPGVAPTTIPVPPAPRVAVAGDSTAFGIAFGFDEWARQSGLASSVAGDSRLGCPVARFEKVRTAVVSRPDSDCQAWPTRFPAMVAAARPDVVVLSSAVWHLPDVVLPGTTRFTHIGTPEVDTFIRDEFVTAVDALASSGALVVLLTWPAYGSWAQMGNTDGLDTSKQPERIGRFNQILTEVSALRPDTTRLVDLAGWFGDRAEDRTLRPDGSHFTDEAFAQIARDWFGPSLVSTWDDWWRLHRLPSG